MTSRIVTPGRGSGAPERGRQACGDGAGGGPKVLWASEGSSSPGGDGRVSRRSLPSAAVTAAAAAATMWAEPNQKDSLELPPAGHRVALSSAHPAGAGSSDGSEQSLSPGSFFSRLSLSALLGLPGGPQHSPSGSSIKPKAEKARSLLRMLMRTQKTDESVADIAVDVHNLIPCGDVVGLLAISVKQCRDFTPRFNVRRDTYLLFRISIDKIMKCTNPQIYKAGLKSSKKNSAINFGDVRYFSVKKQSFTETFAMRIRNMVFCTLEVEFMFCYGCLGYGYSHQLKLPGTDPARAVAYSMFLRVPPPEDRKDRLSNVIKPQQMDYPAFLSPDLNVTVGNVELEKPIEISDEYDSLQRALQLPPKPRLEKMKQEYRNLKTWPEKADYLDQLILKRGPKTRTETKASRFKELVGRVAANPALRNTLLQSRTQAMTQEEKTSTTEKWANAPPEARPILPITPTLVPGPKESVTRRTRSLAEVDEKSHLVPTLTITSSTTICPASSNGTEHPHAKIVRENIRQESETSLSSSGGITETGDSESPAFETKAVDEELLIPAVQTAPEISKQRFRYEVADEIVVPKPSDSVAESIEELPWKELGFRKAIFSGSKFEPFLRHMGRVPAPFPSKSKTSEVSMFGHLEKSYSSIYIKEQEDQDPPHGMSSTETDSNSDTKLKRSGEQLSILRLIERKMELEEESQQLLKQDGEEPKAVQMDFSKKSSGEELSEAEVKQVHIYIRRSLEDFLVDRLVKVVALKSLISKNIENLVAEKFSEANIEDLDDSSLPNAVEGSAAGSQKCLLGERKPLEPDIRNLKAIVSQQLQAHLIGKLSEQGIIPDIGLAENGQKVSFPSSGDLLKRRKSLSKERTSQTEILTIKSLSENESGNGCKTESKIEYDKEISSLKSQSSSVEKTNAKVDLKKEYSKQSLEIIKVKFSSSTETDLNKKLQDEIKQQLSEPEGSPKSSKTVNDTLIEKLLKAEIISLKSCLSKGLQDHLNDKLSETGLSIKEDLEPESWKLSLKGEPKMALERDLLERRQVEKGLAEVYATKDMPVLSKSIQSFMLEALSESEIANLNSVLSKKIQDHLLDRLSEIGLITEKELEKILENLLLVMAKEAPPKGLKGPDLPKEAELSASPMTQNLQDRFTEEELTNLKSLLSKLLKEDHRDRLSDSEVKGLTSILQKSFEDLPVQSSSETGISREVEIKDECHSISLPNAEESSSRGTIVGISDRRKDSSKESDISSASEKHSLKLGPSKNSIFEVEMDSKETQTSGLMFPPKKVKHSSKKECHRLQNYPDKQDMPKSKKGFETVLKSKPPDETFKGVSEPYASSSFLSAHDIGVQTEIKSFFSKPPNYLPKPPFPVNPQTFRFLHSESEEEAKLTSKVHQKPKAKKKSDRSKKDAGSHHMQSAVSNAQIRRERMTSESSSREALKERGKKRVEPSSPKLSATENRKDSKIMVKSEKKRDHEAKPKKSLSRTSALSDPQLQNLAKNLSEKSSSTKFPGSGRAKGNTPNPGGTEDIDVETFKHLEKAIERALLDLGRAPEGGLSQASHSARPYTSPSSAFLVKETSRPLSTNSSAFENPRNPTFSILEMLNNEDQILKMTPDQLEVVLRILQKILHQNTKSPNNG
ncbi:cation channel sperm-associated targeting subunit tau isoform X3 [Hemicordylus capensis]|uniref:cation channel sperm-associated targeting subunit tau isoform X3 n=1 Tax=Hemicordylus capensis TaxID=884348 RepID=UPI0023043675|nr:cation channel sperm-associated targeting subunit tau isoform X3 [Hemicordylus capensis]